MDQGNVENVDENNQGPVDQKKPAVIWSMYFTQTDMSEVQGSNILPENVILMSGPGTEIDIDTPVLQVYFSLFCLSVIQFCPFTKYY